MAGDFPVGFVGMKTCKRVTQESDFLPGSDETESSSLESYLASPRAESVPVKIPAEIWAVGQVTVTADPIKIQIHGEMDPKKGMVLVLAGAVPNRVFLYSSNQNEMGSVRVSCWGFREE